VRRLHSGAIRHVPLASCVCPAFFVTDATGRAGIPCTRIPARGLDQVPRGRLTAMAVCAQKQRDLRRGLPLGQSSRGVWQIFMSLEAVGRITGT